MLLCLEDVMEGLKRTICQRQLETIFGTQDLVNQVSDTSNSLRETRQQFLFPLAPTERQFPYYLSYCAGLGLARPTSYVEQYVKRCMDNPLIQCISEACDLWYFTGLYPYNILCYLRDLVCNDFLIYAYAWVRLFFFNKLHLQKKVHKSDKDIYNVIKEYWKKKMYQD